MGGGGLQYLLLATCSIRFSPRLHHAQYILIAYVISSLIKQSNVARKDEGHRQLYQGYISVYFQASKLPIRTFR